MIISLMPFFFYYRLFLLFLFVPHIFALIMPYPDIFFNIIFLYIAIKLLPSINKTKIKLIWN